MDPLSSLLSGIRAEGSVVSHAVLTAPWSITFADAAPLTMVTVLRGGGTLLLADGTERAIGAGDTAIVQGPARFRLADEPATVHRPHAAYEINCFTADPACSGEELDGIHWGTGPEGATALIMGAYRASGHRHERLLRALPPVLVVAEDAEICAWLENSAADAARLSAGSQALMGPATTRPAGTAASPTPSSPPPCTPSTGGPPTAGRSRRWPLKPTSPGHCSPGASPS